MTRDTSLRPPPADSMQPPPTSTYYPPAPYPPTTHSSVACPPASHSFQSQQPIQQPVGHSDTPSIQGNKLREIIVMAVGAPIYFILYGFFLVILLISGIIALWYLWSMFGINLLFIAIPVALAIIIFLVKDSTVMVSKDVEEMMRKSGQIDENGNPTPSSSYGLYQHLEDPYPGGTSQGYYPTCGQQYQPPSGHQHSHPGNFSIPNSVNEFNAFGPSPVNHPENSESSMNSSDNEQKTNKLPPPSSLQ